MNRTENKITVAILFGGQSAEHDVSINSTRALVNNIDRMKYSFVLIYIDRNGLWRVIEETALIKDDFPTTSITQTGFPFLPWQMDTLQKIDADIYFPMLHGPNGEDGKIQSLLELAGKPCVGAAAAASSLAMDKVASKILFKNAGLNVGPFLFFESNDFSRIKKEVDENLEYPVFVKPCAMGSSVGITRAESESDLKKCIDLAFRYDRKILVEKALDIREIEVSVMGNDTIMVSRPSELIPHNQFYDYKDKYLDGKTTFHMPAELEKETEENIREIAGKAYKTLFLNGMSRVDLFIEKHTGTIYINEINTIPGFTEISMFPKLWMLEGISFTELITRLIEYGFEFHNKHKAAVDLHD